MDGYGTIAIEKLGIEMEWKVCNRFFSKILFLWINRKFLKLIEKF